MTTPHSTLRATRRPAHLALAGGTAAACLAVLIIVTFVALSWKNQLPDPVAIHWGTSGKPDGFGSLPWAIIPMMAIAVLVLLLFGAITAWWGQSSMNRRLGVAGSVWITTFVSINALASLEVQKGLSNAHGATGIGWIIAIANIGALALAVITFFLVPSDPPQPASTQLPAEAATIPLAPGERAVWIHDTFSGPGLIVAGLAVLAFLALALLTQTWGLLIIPLVLVAVMGCMISFVVRVDASGLTIKSVAGWPRISVPANEVIEAKVVPVRAFFEFGGWGWRVGRQGRVGIVPRSGQGIQVERTGDRCLVVVVDDAEKGAALLNAMAAQTRHEDRLH